MKKRVKLLAGLVTVLVLGIGSVVLASPNTELQQVIGAGTLSTDILNASQAPVANPSVDLSSLNVSTLCQTSTGTFGTNSERIYVDNPGASNTGWVLSLAATDGVSAEWDSGGNQYDFNNPAGSGCTGGQLTVNPAAGTTHPQSPATSTGITLGSQAAFSQGVTDSIELVNAGSSSDDMWRGYFTGISLSQAVPGATPAGSYALDMTQTVVSQ